MVTYTYRHTNGSGTFEVKQEITDEPLARCPECGKPVERVITGGTATLFFMGKGWASRETL